MAPAAQCANVGRRGLCFRLGNSHPLWHVDFDLTCGPWLTRHNAAAQGRRTLNEFDNYQALRTKVFEPNERLFRTFSTPARSTNTVALVSLTASVSSGNGLIGDSADLSQKYFIAHILVAVFYTELSKHRTFSVRPPLRELAASIDPIRCRPWISHIDSPRNPIQGRWTGHYTYTILGRTSSQMAIELRSIPARVQDQVQIEVLGMGNDDVGEFYLHGTVDAVTGEVFLEKVYKRGRL
jgi:hypothetical protein